MNLLERLRHRSDFWLSIACGLLAVTPLFLLHRLTAGVFWFGDEWELLDQIERLGLGPWINTTFAENYLPVFKFLWGSAAVLGSYPVMLYLLWFTHAACMAVFYRLMRAGDFSPLAAAVISTLAGIGSMNIETLTWTVQWSSVLATAFTLAAVWAFIACRPLETPSPGKGIVLLVVLCAGAAFSFSRGVLAGIVIAAVAVFPPTSSACHWRRRVTVALLVLLPFAWSAYNIARFAGGNHHAINTDNLGAMLRFAWSYYALNPIHLWVQFDSWGWRTSLIFGLPKVAAAGWMLCACSPRMRRMALLLILLDIANALLLGLGRHHTGLEASTSSRYQYASLLSTLPIYGWCVITAIARLPTLQAPLHARAALAMVVALAALAAVRQWPDQARFYAEWRGAQTRQVLRTESTAPPMGAIPGIPFMSTDRARELKQRFNLR